MSQGFTRPFSHAAPRTYRGRFLKRARSPLPECTVYGTLHWWESNLGHLEHTWAPRLRPSKDRAIFFRTEAGGEPLRDWLKKSASTRGSQAHWGGHQDSGVRLANRDAGLQAIRGWHL
jgi:DNA-binding PadR family transcriptional regulator